jgi:hypothetical protein
MLSKDKCVKSGRPRCRDGNYGDDEAAVTEMIEGVPDGALPPTMRTETTESCS